MPIRLLAALASLAIASPALAQASAQVSEGSHLTLFALGVVGVLVGRHVARGRRPD